MSVSVRIPTILRTYTGGESEVAANGDTLAAVLDDLDSNYSGIKGRIVDEQGELRRFVNVYVGNDDVRFLDSLATATPEGTQISVIPAVAGGCPAGAGRATLGSGPAEGSETLGQVSSLRLVVAQV